MVVDVRNSGPATVSHFVGIIVVVVVPEMNRLFVHGVRRISPQMVKSKP